jgi:serine protease Do
MIIDKRGYIVTNNHVVAHASRIRVSLPSNESLEIPARLVGSDPRTDIAMIKIEAKGDLPSIQWADSDNVEVGDWAIAIGSPFALSHSVTAGIVSAKGRNASEVAGEGYGYGMLQTDAAINPGNSGGPLCTLDGLVMGVNTAILSKSGGYMGIGFAIPSNVARKIAQTLIEKGRVVRGWLGVTIQPIDPEMAKELGTDRGAIVHEVTPGSPAERAGIEAGDAILEVNGTPVQSPSELEARIGETTPGEAVTLKVVSYQDRKTRTVRLRIGKAPDEDGRG